MSSRPRAPGVLERNKRSNIGARLVWQKLWKPPNLDDNWAVFVIVGREGSGKSKTCASMLEMADPSFTAESVHFDPEDILRAISNMSKSEREGTAMMLDEAGAGLGVRSWYEKDQIKFNQAMQTARDDNMIVGLTLPRLEELDSQFEGRLHGFCEMQAVEDGEYAELSWKNFNPTRDGRNEDKKKFPRLRVNGRKQRVTSFKIGLPSKQFIEVYEARKQAFKAQFYEEALEEYDDEDDEDVEPADVADRILEEERVAEFVSQNPANKMRYIDKDLIRAEFELSQREAKQAKKLLQKQVEI